MSRNNPSPDFSKYLTSDGYSNVRLTHYQPPASNKPSIVKISLNKTLPPPPPRSQSKEGNLTSRKKAQLKTINVRNGTTKLCLHLLRFGFKQLKINRTSQRRLLSFHKIEDIFTKGRISRMYNGYQQLYKNMHRIRRYFTFASKITKLCNRFKDDRLKATIARISIYNNIILFRQSKNDYKNKITNFEKIFKRLVNSRIKYCLTYFNLLRNQFKKKQKSLNKFPALFKNIIKRNIMQAFHKLCVWRKPAQRLPPKPSRSLTKNLKTQQNQSLISDQKYKQLELDLQKTKKDLKSQQQLLKRSQTERNKFQKQSLRKAQQVKNYQNQNKLLKSKVQEMSMQQKNLRQSRNSKNSRNSQQLSDQQLFDQQIDFKDDKSMKSSASKKSILSNFSGRSFVENASVMSLNTMAILKKLTGKNNALQDCCQSKKLYHQFQTKYNQMKSKLQTLQIQHQLIKQINKSMELVLQGNIVTSTNNEQVQKMKKQNIQLKASIQGYKSQVDKLKQQKEKSKKNFKKKLQDIYNKVIKKKSQSLLQV